MHNHYQRTLQIYSFSVNFFSHWKQIFSLTFCSCLLKVDQMWSLVILLNLCRLHCVPVCYHTATIGRGTFHTWFAIAHCQYWPLLFQFLFVKYGTFLQRYVRKQFKFWIKFVMLNDDKELNNYLKQTKKYTTS